MVVCPAAKGSIHRPPLRAGLWELVWLVLITNCIFFRPHVALRSGRCCSGKQAGSRRGNKGSAQRDRVQTVTLAERQSTGFASVTSCWPTLGTAWPLNTPTHASVGLHLICYQTHPETLIARISFTSLIFLVICVVCVSTSPQR